MKTEVDKLAEKILFHKDLYYQGNPEIDDSEYDKLEDKLKKLSPDHPVLSLVGSVLKNSDKVSHDKKMLSLDKTYVYEDLLSWRKDEEVVSTFKIDGSSCSLIFEQGNLIIAKTRGDGSSGEKVTQKILWIPEIPKTISFKEKVEIRGEVYCTEENFLKLSLEMEKLNLEKPSSQRNIVAGFLGRKDHLNLCRYLSFKAFDVISDHMQFVKEQKKFEWLRKENFPIPDFEIHKDEKSIKRVLQETLDFMNDGNYLIDGLVFTFNNTNLHEELGETAHHPRYKMAFKFAGEAKVAEIESIYWGVSRNGYLTPVAVIKPIELSGAKITNVTLHNFGIVKIHQLKTGDEIEVIRSGEVIPKFLRVISSSANKFTVPFNCPSCESKLEEKEIRLICNNSSCPAKVHAEILNFIHKIEIEDLSEKRLHEMMDNGLVKDIPSLYKLTEEDVLKLDKVKEKLANKIITNIQKTKIVELTKFLSALGITGGAYNKCEKVTLNGFNTIEKVLSLKIEDLVNIEGFAEKSANDFLQSLKSKHKLIQQLIDCGFRFTKKEMASQKLAGIKICITGELSMKRSEMEKLIKSNGGVLVSSVTSQTSYLLSNEIESSSSKFKKAKELEIKIISENDFLKNYLE
ncbi:MAG: NAD-dependent DNA ligase LigA [Bacteriovoracaceae bacterium]